MRADVGGVGCPDLGGSPSWASGEVDRVSGQHCSGNTRGFTLGLASTRTTSSENSFRSSPRPKGRA
eukprot:7230387-Prymnesium_polylepis.1